MTVHTRIVYAAPLLLAASLAFADDEGLPGAPAGITPYGRRLAGSDPNPSGPADGPLDPPAPTVPPRTGPTDGPLEPDAPAQPPVAPRPNPRANELQPNPRPRPEADTPSASPTPNPTASGVPSSGGGAVGLSGRLEGRSSTPTTAPSRPARQTRTETVAERRERERRERWEYMGLGYIEELALRLEHSVGIYETQKLMNELAWLGRELDAGRLTLEGLGQRLDLAYQAWEERVRAWEASQIDTGSIYATGVQAQINAQIELRKNLEARYQRGEITWVEKVFGPFFLPSGTPGAPTMNLDNTVGLLGMGVRFGPTAQVRPVRPMRPVRPRPTRPRPRRSSRPSPRVRPSGTTRPSGTRPPTRPRTPNRPPVGGRFNNLNRLPEAARQRLEDVLNGRRGNIRGGQTFENKSDPSNPKKNWKNGSRPLPTHNARGEEITYTEWDVNPRQPGQNRDAERFVIGSDGRVYYTSTHYDTWILVRHPALAPSPLPSPVVVPTPGAGGY